MTLIPWLNTTDVMYNTLIFHRYPVPYGFCITVFLPRPRHGALAVAHALQGVRQELQGGGLQGARPGRVAIMTSIIYNVNPGLINHGLLIRGVLPK